jgi:hypothetical protein
MSTRSDLGDVTPNNLGQVRILHKVLFPVNYGENFYTELLEAGEFAKLGTRFFFSLKKGTQTLTC